MSTSPLKVVFAGTPEFAAHHLQLLINSEHKICAVYTQPDRPAGRGRKLTASPVKQLALNHDLTVYQPESLKSFEARQQLRELDADIMVVVAYGIILPVEILEITSLGCINVHASILPRWRGAAPIQRAIEAGDPETGITIMQMDAGLDTGDMLLSACVPIGEKDTSQILHDKLAATGSSLLLEALNKLSEGTQTLTAQDGAKATYAKKLSKAEASIDWSLSSEQLDRKARAFDPWPGSFVTLNGQKMKVILRRFPNDQTNSSHFEHQAPSPGTIISANEMGLRVACGEGSLLIQSLQLPGKKMIDITSLLNAYQDRFQPGTAFDL